MAAFWFVVLLVAGFAATAADSTSKPTYVTSLPGLDGPLPSRLETGYVTVDEENGAELFYYFVESEGDPRRDPVLLWLTGGDRCSVLSGLVFEIGPVELVREPYDGVSLPRLRRNPSSWTKVASILFVDSPVGAGFSFSRDPSGYDVGDISASLQLVKFLRKWFSEHEDYLANPFYVGGGSYAGKLVPFITQKISEGGRIPASFVHQNSPHQNRTQSLMCREPYHLIPVITPTEIDLENICSANCIEAGVRPTINLKGYTVGSPLTGDSSDFDSRVPYCHGVGIISDQLYKLFDEISAPHILYSKCIAVSPGPSNARTTSGRKILKEEVGLLQNPPPRPAIECVIKPNRDSTKLNMSNIKYQTNVDHPKWLTRSTQDTEVTQAETDTEYTHYLLYFWVNNNATLETLGIKKGTVNEWVRCHQGDLPYDEDIENSIKYHRNVVSQDYRALVYSGDHDAVVPFLSTQAWVRSLTDLVVDDWRAWHLDGQSAGFTITYGNNVTFTTVKF
uniref:Uncharacterized protein n=1 Tax=Oryza brachyantha TaxID=4533 RepID=J3N7X2_ORYBR